jgi:hypothetical protein
MHQVYDCFQIASAIPLRKKKAKNVAKCHPDKITESANGCRLTGHDDIEMTSLGCV